MTRQPAAGDADAGRQALADAGITAGVWGVQATGVVLAWVPLMIFAFLYGISMDYEVFMITRIRESYDETGNTTEAVSLGLARASRTTVRCAP